MDDIPLVEDLIQVNIFLYDIDIVDGSIVGEPARRSVQKYCNTVRLLRYNNHICYVSNINALLKAYRCSTCNQFFDKLETWNVTWLFARIASNTFMRELFIN